MTAIDPAATYRQEAADLLEQLEQALLDLDSRPSDRDLVDDAFRALHTLKGSGAMFGFTDVATFTHEFETAFDRLRKTGAPAGRQLVAAALAAKDHIRALIETPETAERVFGDAILAELRDLASDAGMDATASGSGETAGAGTPAGGPAREFRISIGFSPRIMLNGTNPLHLLEELGNLGACRVVPDLAHLPPLDRLDPSLCHVAFTVHLVTEQPRSAIESVFEFVLGETELDITETGLAEDRTLAVPEAAEKLSTAPAGPERARQEGQGSRDGSARAGATVRVPAERLDRLMDRVGELVIAQARLTQLSGSRRDGSIQTVAEEIERLVAGLRDAAMGMRMVPIGSLFGRFRRLVHDLAHELGKPVELVTSGEETELDKTVIDRLADPLVHLIRNAVDHGLEKPDARRAAGKPATGTIRLAAGHVGAEVHITVEDDGRGVDLARLRAKGEEMGLLPPGASASEAELLDLMFAPGFSTAREISALSGRGVGMDVVRKTIEGLRGEIGVSNSPGAGATFTLRLPLTLAIIEGLLVRVGEGRYIIPLSAVEECVELSRSDEERSSHRSFLNVRGELVPFLRLRQVFGDAPASEPHQKVVIVSSGDARVGLVVDQILGNHQAVIKSLSRLHRDVRTFSGATILGDGLPALILDVGQLVLAGEGRPGREREAA